MTTEPAQPEDIAVTKFREYLRVNTEQPNPDYEACKDFLFNYAKELGVDAWEYECAVGKPFIGMTIQGTDPALPSLLLHSHTDVVPTYKDQWKYDPYSGYKDAEGNIYGRGTQDMKSQGIIYAEAIRRLKAADEEIGGDAGMEAFVHTEKFKEMNVGFALDESLASEEEAYTIYYGERSTWWLKVSCHGRPGHGSRFIEDTAAAKFQNVLTTFMSFREQQSRKLAENKDLKLGDVISLNLTHIEGGVQANVVPAVLCATFDIRVPPTTDFDAFEEQIANWCRKAGKGVEYEFIKQRRCREVTPVTKDDPWWNAFSTVLEEEDCKMSVEIDIGSSDSSHLRENGYRAIGFSPLNNTPCLLHENNEFVNEKVFLRAVDLFTKLIPRLADLQPSVDAYRTIFSN
ncbi:aminoacylase-1-like isoform 1 [Aphelenchoides avenae]|nr:aminoacylase-1-like isoform 1 [Aphelenchus avenae]